MTSADDSLQTIFRQCREAGASGHRAGLRRHAAVYRRNPATLLYWTFPNSRASVTSAIACPDDPAATRALCRALWRDLRAARALPRYLAGRPLRITALRMLFACECTHYLAQRAPTRDQPATRPLTTGEWLNGICRTIESNSETDPPPIPAIRGRSQP